ncbi:MAG: hypothetical protein IPQ24_20200 [Anaeromyxobacter sp.]|nr:hypothetical protein [Anaeromyxobacter sp.]
MAAPPPRAPPLDPKAPQDSSGRARSAGDELVEACTALEAEVEELKAKYEMYFLGVELREPAKWREEVRKRVLRLKEQFTRNTGLRFRVQSLHARFISYERLWLRSAREREEGTYRRDLFKARLHARGRAGAEAARGAPRAKAGATGLEQHAGEDVDLSDFGDAPAAASGAGLQAGPTSPPPPAPAAALPGGAVTPPRPAGPGVSPPVKPAAPASASPPARPAAQAPSPAAAGRLGEAQLRELYDAYISAKKRCNEDTSRLTYDAVSRSVTKQIPEIMRQHDASAVEFKVVIKDGKAKLTAVPRKG